MMMRMMAFGVLNTMSRNDLHGGYFFLILIRLNFSSTLSWVL